MGFGLQFLFEFSIIDILERSQPVQFIGLLTTSQCGVSLESVIALQEGSGAASKEADGFRNPWLRKTYQLRYI